MAYSSIFWRPTTYFSPRFIAYQIIEVTSFICSILEDLALIWNSLLWEIFLVFTWLLCITSSSSLCTKNVLLSKLGELPKTIDNITEEMDYRIIGYVRVSSREQANNSHALEQQRARVTNAGALYIFEDVQKGRGKKRPAYEDMIRLIKRGKVEEIIITRIDRAARSIRGIQELVEILNEYEVRLIALDQNLDLGSAQGKIWLHILAALAEWEVDLLSERVKHG